MIYCYVADEHWNTGLGHRTRFEALREACALKGLKVERVSKPIVVVATEDDFTHMRGGVPCSLDAGGNLVIRQRPEDALAFALLRPQFAKHRPPAPLPDWWPVVTCPPSTRALEAACLGFRVILTEPRNDGEYRLYQKLLQAQSDPGLFNAIDGLGADRCADLLLTSLNSGTRP